MVQRKLLTAKVDKSGHELRDCSVMRQAATGGLQPAKYQLIKLRHLTRSDHMNRLWGSMVVAVVSRVNGVIKALEGIIVCAQSPTHNSG